MRLLFVTSIIVAALGCQPPIILPTVEVSSPHFRYFATSADRIPDGILDRLEQHRADISGYLGFPDEGVTNYYLFDTLEGFNKVYCVEEGGPCTYQGAVYTTSVFDQHELIHAYLANWAPPALIREGTAEAFHCGEGLSEVSQAIYASPPTADWTAVVTQNPPDPDVYISGVRLVLFLIRTYGPGQFLKYYQTAHLTDDPALFGFEFQRFWGQSIDVAWTTLLEDLSSTLFSICPCGQPNVSTDGSSTALSAFDDYRVLPPAQDGQTLLMQLVGDAPKLTKCTGGEAMPMRGVEETGAPNIQPAIAAIMTDQDRYFLSFNGAGSSTGQWQPLIQSDCLGAGVLPVSLQTDYVAVGVPRRADGSAWYVKLSFTGQATTSRDDGGPIVLTSCSDCDYNCISEPQYTQLIFQERAFGLTLPPSAADTNVGIAIFEQWYGGSQ